jgi:predicted Zn-dependent protease
VQQRQIKLYALALLCAWGLTAAVQAKKKEAPVEVGDPAESAYLTYDYIFVDAPQIEAYLQELIGRLLAAKSVKLDMPDILIRSSEDFDIFTDASRNLVVSTELLRQIGSEDELSAVLGHEISHQILKHPQRKNAARAFPMGLDTLSMVKTAASNSKGASRYSYSGDLNQFGQESLTNIQTANLLWSDLISPSWNRKQERIADQNGFELMRAAGYDPSAFGALFERLHAAAGKRTARLEVLKKVMLAKAKKSKPKKAARKQSDQLATQLQDSLTAEATEAVISGLASFNRDYDSPDERQRLLAEYARAHRERKLSTGKPTGRFKIVLRQGAGARLLADDAAAIQTLNAFTARNVALADKAVRRILPATPGGRVAAPHLNLAVGAWYHTHGKPQIGELYAKAWLAARRPPAQAYVWVAYYQASRRELSPAITTLEQGRKRVGNSQPFLPHLVSLARAAGQKDKAERYTVQCLEEDQKSLGNKVANMVRGQQLPSGLYADCVRRLGHEPEAGKEHNAALSAFKHPVETTKSLTSKVRDKLRRNK